MRKIAELVVLCLIVIVLSGCFSANPDHIKAFKKPTESITTSDQYVLEPPDQITVESKNVPELDGKTQIIGPDGKVYFENVGEVYVAGKTPKEVAKLIYERISNLYMLPNDDAVNVRVSTYDSKYYFIVGQVEKPGAKVFSGRETTLSAIAKANPNVRAWEQRIQIIRAPEDGAGTPMIFELDYEKMIVHGDMSKNVLLRENDIVYVPPTILGAAGLTLEEFIGPTITGLQGYRAVTGDYNR